MTMREDDSEYSCVVHLRLVGPWLIGTDNIYYGGANVRFQNVYRRKP